MRRTLHYGLTLALILGIAEGQASQVATRLPDSRPIAAAGANRGPCDEERWLRITPRESTAELVRGLIRCATNRWPVAGGAPKAIAVADCESSLWPFAVGADNLGVFQHKDDYWQSRVRALLRPAWFNDHQWERIDRDARVFPGAAFLARANVLIAIRMAHAGGWGPWACA